MIIYDGVFTFSLWVYEAGRVVHFWVKIGLIWSKSSNNIYIYIYIDSGRNITRRPGLDLDLVRKQSLITHVAFGEIMVVRIPFLGFLEVWSISFTPFSTISISISEQVHLLASAFSNTSSLVPLVRHVLVPFKTSKSFNINILALSSPYYLSFFHIVIYDHLMNKIWWNLTTNNRIFQFDHFIISFQRLHNLKLH